VPWARKAIEVLASKGIIRGKTETEYAPQTDISRAEFLYSLVRTLGVTASFDENFDDIEIGAYYYKE
jgi:lactocepin